MILYKNYHIVKGSGENDFSNINAFDEALLEANISEANLVAVSSILSKNSIEDISIPKIEIGEIVHCVLARQDGVMGEMVGAGVACITGYNEKGHYGLVMEIHGNYNEEKLRAGLEERINQMVKLRNFTVESKKIIVCSIDKITKKYGSVIVAVIFR